MEVHRIVFFLLNQNRWEAMETLISEKTGTAFLIACNPLFNFATWSVGIYDSHMYFSSQILFACDFVCMWLLVVFWGSLVRWPVVCLQYCSVALAKKCVFAPGKEFLSPPAFCWMYFQVLSLEFLRNLRNVKISAPSKSLRKKRFCAKENFSLPSVFCCTTHLSLSGMLFCPL